ncbi:chemotaxis protein CheA [Campylobacterota bacterium]|nr:chemotaxis protein CheA [Campylobacterota bacterium]
MTEYQLLFMQEAAELFANANECLLSAEEKDFMDRGEIAELFRILHTLKGGGGSVDFDHVSHFAHKIENLLSELREGKIAYQKGMAGFLVDSVDRLQEILNADAKGAIDEADFEAQLRKLDEKIAAFGEGGGGVIESLQNGEADEGFMLFTPEQIAAFGEGGNAIEIGGTIASLQNGGADEGFMLFTPEQILQAQSAENAKPENPAKQENLDAKNPAISEAPHELARSDDPKPLFEKNSHIRVDLDKIDHLLDYVGELVLTNSVLARFAEKISVRSDREELEERLAQLTRHIRGMQDAVMAVRMIPLEQIYAKLPKVVRDLSKKLGKKARMSYSGGSVEIDKLMIEGLTDPLNHIIRNSIDHGIESAEERAAASKSEIALISIDAVQENAQIVISVSDDGRGIDSEAVARKAIDSKIISAVQAEKMSDEEKNALIFSAGLTTAVKVTDISGRGVGMDVVRSNIAKLGGFVRISSKKSVGTRISIALPLTLAILDGLNVSVGDRTYILPLSLVVESLQPNESMIQTNGDGSRMFLMLRDEFIPIIELHSLFGVTPKHTVFSKGILIVARSGTEKVALFVDSFGAQRQVVVKSLEKNFRRVTGVSGVTVQGDGTVVLILDPIGLAEKEREISEMNHIAGGGGVGGRGEVGGETKLRSEKTRSHSFEGAREFLIFRMFGLPYGVLLKAVSKIVTNHLKITPLPFSHSWVLGVINLRGEITPVIDFRLKFSKMQIVYDEETIIVALKFPGDRIMAIVVDSIETIAELDYRDIQNPADLGGGLDARLLDGLAKIDNEMVSIINIEKMLTIDEL